MTTPIDRKHALPEVSRTRLGVAPAAAALFLLTAAGLACSPPQEPAAPVSTPAPMVPAPGPSPDGTAAANAGTGAEAQPAQAEPPATTPPAAPEPAPAPGPESAPPPPREPKMEWREGSARAAEEGDSTGIGGKKVFTNADLSRYARPEDAAAGDAAATDRRAQEAFDAAAVKKVQDLPATEAWKAKTRADAESQVRSAEARLDALRRLSQSDANPLLPQPILSPEEQKKREGLGAEQRYKLTQQEIQQAEQALADAKAELARVQQNLAPPR